jgi:signal transduction histidine kinase
VVREEIRRLNGIIEDFVGPARERRTDFRPERLIDLLERVVQLAKEEVGSRDIQIQSEWEDPNLMVYMDSGRMHQALLNLIKNALESVVGQGKIIISAHPNGAHHAVVRIEDTGVGIPAKDLERVFEFEYTTKEKGLGLGLPMSREIIQAHGGDIKVESEPGKGTTLEIILPRKDK